VAAIAGTSACDGYSGADLESLIRKAGQHALKSQKNRVEMEDFEFAVGSIKGSVGSMDKYYRLRDKFMHRQ
jgi:ribosome biogenesis ATPase